MASIAQVLKVSVDTFFVIVPSTSSGVLTVNGVPLPEILLFIILL